MEVLFAFTALFEKASQPQNYLYQLQQFYAATRDFRLLAGLADAVIGHTAGQVYPFLQGMSGVLGEVRDEATADSIVERIVAARGRGPRPRWTAGPSTCWRCSSSAAPRKSRTSPARTCKGRWRPCGGRGSAQWSPGEPRLMAELLASLGHIAQQPLADEQIAELESLHREAQPGTADRLKIGTCLAQTYWAYSRFDPAIDLLDANRSMSTRRPAAACCPHRPTTPWAS